MLRETVAEYIQVLKLRPEELAGFHYFDPGPELLPRDREVSLYGGGVLIFDEYGRLKFHIHNRLNNRDRQNERIRFFADQGYYQRQRSKRKPGAKLSSFGLLHLMRSVGAPKEALQRQPERDHQPEGQEDRNEAI